MSRIDEDALLRYVDTRISFWKGYVKLATQGNWNRDFGRGSLRALRDLRNTFFGFAFASESEDRGEGLAGQTSGAEDNPKGELMSDEGFSQQPEGDEHIGMPQFVVRTTRGVRSTVVRRALLHDERNGTTHPVTSWIDFDDSGKSYKIIEPSAIMLDGVRYQFDYVKQAAGEDGPTFHYKACS